jgi:hypothetical protein
MTQRFRNFCLMMISQRNQRRWPSRRKLRFLLVVSGIQVSAEGTFVVVPATTEPEVDFVAEGHMEPPMEVMEDPEEDTEGTSPEEEDTASLPPNNREHRQVCVNTFIAGSIRFSIDNWEKITSDKWVLNTIRYGYVIEFSSVPYQVREPRPIPYSRDMLACLDAEIEGMIGKGAVEICNECDDQFISNMFLVEKPGNKFRPVINLKELNTFVEYHHFKQETFQVVCELVQPNDYFVHLDLKDAYFSVPIHVDSRKYLRFRWRGHVYQFTCLCFGLASAPRIYTKIMKPVFAYFRSLGIRTSYFIDDSIYLNQLIKLLREQIAFVMDTLVSLGFMLNMEKSLVIPTQIITHLGFLLNSLTMVVKLPEKKVNKVVDQCKWTLNADKTSIRSIAKLIGLLVSSFPAIFGGQMHYRSLERDKTAALQSNGNFDSYMDLSVAAKSEVVWWSENIQQENGRSIATHKPGMVIESDASLEGWGAVCQDNSVNGRWSVSESEHHINYLELLAIFLALKCFCCDTCETSVLVYSDSTTAIAYINKMGGVRSVLLDSLAAEIWHWCNTRKIVLFATHEPGVDNSLPDFLSRNFDENLDWKLKSIIFDRLCAQLSRPEVDLFASRINSQLNKFVSWKSQPGAWAIDAFTLDWNCFTGYAFPPFRIIQRVLNKVMTEHVQEVLLVVPWWSTQPWFPVLLHLLIDFPVRLPQHKDLLVLPHSGQLYPLRNRIVLVGCRVSGVPSLAEEFRRRQQNTVCLHGGLEQINNTSVHGRRGIFGHAAGVSIPIARLRTTS